MGTWGGHPRHSKERDLYSKKKQSHALKRIKQRSSLSHEAIRKSISSGKARCVGKARYNRDLYGIAEPNGRKIYAVWDQRHWAIKTVLTQSMVKRGWGVTLFEEIDEAA